MKQSFLTLVWSELENKANCAYTWRQVGMQGFVIK
jgi:hypothetical protein